MIVFMTVGYGISITVKVEVVRYAIIVQVVSALCCIRDAITVCIDGVDIALYNAGVILCSCYSGVCRCRVLGIITSCLLYTSPSPRDATLSRMPSSA